MLNLLIVDDEQIMRKAISAIVKKYIPEISHVYETDSGRKAVEIARQKQIHIVCMDIKMPGIDGIEAISLMKKILPEAAFLIISAFDEFESAAKAIRLGVKQYLLKPLERDEFIRTVYQVIEEQKSKMAQREKELRLTESISVLQENLARQVLYALMTGSLDDLSGNSLTGLEESFAYGGAAFVISIHTLPEQTREGRVWIDKTERAVCEFLGARGGVAGRVLENRLAVFASAGEPEKKGEDFVRRTAMEIQKRVAVPPGGGAVVGAGSYVDTLARMNLSYCHASQAAEREGRPGLHVVFGDETTSFPYHYPYEMEQEIFRAIKNEDGPLAAERFSELFSYIVAYANGGNEFIYRQLYIFTIGLERLRIEKNMEGLPGMGLEYMSDILSMYKWCEQSIQDCVFDLEHRVAAYSDNLIEEAVSYIHEHYDQSITLGDISGRVYVSSYYFTKLFKAKTGKTFVEYLTDYRIRMAKKLLKENLDYRIQDVCEKVGYSDKKYFSKCFKKITGMTPASYRDSI